jgi:predicted nucleotidyltransferase
MELSLLRGIQGVEMTALFVSTEPDSPYKTCSENLKQSQWSMLQEQRARLHREFCVKAANQVIDELRDIGVDAVIFGSLACESSMFRGDSDVDLCLLNKVLPLGEIEAVVRKSLGSVKYDLVEFENIGPRVRQEVIANGVHHVQ